MALEDLTGTSKFIDDLVLTNPITGDPRSEGDDHLRGIKNVLFNCFEFITGKVTASHTELNLLKDVTHIPKYDILTADLAVNNTATLTATGLLTALDASSFYEVEFLGNFFTTGTTAADAKFAWEYSGTLLYTSAALSVRHTSLTGLRTEDNLLESVGYLSLARLLSSKQEHSIHLHGILATNAAGDFDIKFAQIVPEAVDTIIRKGSFLKTTKIA